MELFDSAIRQTDGADAIVVVFARDSLVSFSKMMEKVFQLLNLFLLYTTPNYGITPF